MRVFLSDWKAERSRVERISETSRSLTMSDEHKMMGELVLKTLARRWQKVRAEKQNSEEQCGLCELRNKLICLFKTVSKAGRPCSNFKKVEFSLLEKVNFFLLGMALPIRICHYTFGHP